MKHAYLERGAAPVFEVSTRETCVFGLSDEGPFSGFMLFTLEISDLEPMAPSNQSIVVGV